MSERKSKKQNKYLKHAVTVMSSVVKENRYNLQEARKRNKKKLEWNERNLLTHVNVKLITIFMFFCMVYVSTFQISMSWWFVPSLQDQLQGEIYKEKSFLQNQTTSKEIALRYSINKIVEQIQYEAYLVSDVLGDREYHPIRWQNYLADSYEDISLKISEYENQGLNPKLVLEGKNIIYHNDFEKMTSKQR